MNKIYTSVVLVATLLLASCGSDDKKTAVDNSPAVKVAVQKVVADGNNPFVTASGKIQATNSANLSTRMMGFVKKVYVKVGDKVNKGQLLISINNADLQAKAAQVNAGITEATAAYNNAEKDYNRFKNLFEQKSASQKEMDDMTAHFEMAKARLEAAKQMKNEVNAQFSYANIRAPFKGVVTNKFIEEGDMANPGMPLVEVETPGRFEVTAMVPESEISQIKADTEVDVLVKSINKMIKGKVTEVSTSAKNTGGQYLVKVDLGKLDANILSGMYATVQFPVEKTSKANSMVLIPTKALVIKGQLSGVYTVSQSNTAVLRWLRLGRTFGDNVEVLSGLSAGESFIISSQGKLYNGAKITIQ
ncbi:efflux RND transporter periplasmic adaptor subunit [Tenacibaculum sp. IB213877]|uniref:efflux RND transporter periplasmic adaptor subunit n=1 Tax=Tenacibaculum sp. IB213877 TaxID=3097351 RepID=UPI002A599B54|nr:efflux RND transporter periplasmic adaptor subunit [Tenacibaculum sp. IB213877]MDY0780979.1 efflux RND transporter periplasmic adaptor subunit [Tenacibaculum sp. IB213877]